MKCGQIKKFFENLSKITKEFCYSAISTRNVSLNSGNDLSYTQLYVQSVRLNDVEIFDQDNYT